VSFQISFWEQSRKLQADICQCMYKAYIYLEGKFNRPVQLKAESFGAASALIRQFSMSSHLGIKFFEIRSS